ncbi:MAG: hypothetical protein J5629_05065 [Muribaculaceae bacterium]|nr:hypothetical protein [Muribaculaceae bacterium]
MRYEPLCWLCRFAALAGCVASLRSLVVSLAVLAGCVASLRSLVVSLRCARWLCRFAALAGFEWVLLV